MNTVPLDRTIFEVWKCHACGVWNRLDYYENTVCANCRSKRIGDEQMGRMDSDEYIKQIRYNGTDVWGLIKGGNT